jgi:hypothetical protein
MNRFILIFGCVLQFALSPYILSQTTQLDFLTLPSNAEMMGMGYASVAHISDNPSALTFNPSHLGMQSLDRSFAAISTNYIDWAPAAWEGSYIRSISAEGGVNLQKYYPSLPSISLGLAYTNLRFNSGSYYYVDEHWQNHYCYAYDVADQFTVSVGADFLVRASIGFTYKSINSHRLQDIDAGLYDMGLLINIPVTKIITTATGKSILKYKNFTPFVDVNVGLAKSNMGKDSIVYSTGERGLVSRYAREGLEYALGFTYEKDNIKINPLSFSWTVESNDRLAGDWYDISAKGYQSGMGDINFFKELIVGKGNVNTDKLKGWELGFFDMVMLSGGSFTEDYNHGNRNFTTSGFSFRLSGFLKTMSLVDRDFLDGNTMQYISKHLDVKITSSLVSMKNGYYILDGMKYYSLNLYWTNW